jgi:hypothetical protein
MTERYEQPPITGLSPEAKVSDKLIDWYHEAIELQDKYTTSDMQARAEVVAREIVRMVLES